MDKYEYYALESSINLGLDIAEEGLFSGFKSKMKSYADKQSLKNKVLTYTSSKPSTGSASMKYVRPVLKFTPSEMKKMCGKLPGKVDMKKPWNSILEDCKYIHAKMRSSSAFKTALADFLNQLIDAKGVEFVQRIMNGMDNALFMIPISPESTLAYLNPRIIVGTMNDTKIEIGNQDPPFDTFITPSMSEVFLKILSSDPKYKGVITGMWSDDDGNIYFDFTE